MKISSKFIISLIILNITTYSVAQESNYSDLNFIKKIISTKGINNEEINKTLIIATDNNDFEIIQFLLDNGLDINVYDESFGNPLIFATEKKHLKMLEFLLNKGANINIKDPDDNETPLMAAVKFGHEEVVVFLLMQGADINVKNKRGHTAIDIAKYLEHQHRISLSRDPRCKNIVKILEEWPIKIKQLQKEISIKLKEANVVPNIEGIRDIITEYALGIYKEKSQENEEIHELNKPLIKKAKL